MPDNSQPSWSILHPFMGIPFPGSAPAPSSPLEQAARSAPFNFSDQSLDATRDQAENRARASSLLIDTAGALLEKAPQPYLKIGGRALDGLSGLFALSEPQRADDIYNQMLSRQLNDNMNARIGGDNSPAMVRGFLPFF